MLLRALLAASLASPLALGAASALAGGDTYELRVTDAKAKVGEKGTTSVIISGKNGWKVNEEAPISIKLSPGTGVSIDKSKLTKSDLAERTKDKARFDVAFTSAEVGRKTIDAEASFVMCQAEACKPVKEKLVLAVDVVPEPGAKKK